MSIFVQLEHANRYKDSQICSLHVSRMVMSKISSSDVIRHRYQQMNSFQLTFRKIVQINIAGLCPVTDCVGFV